MPSYGLSDTNDFYNEKSFNATLARILNIRPGKRSYKYASRLITDSSMFQYINVALFSNINAEHIKKSNITEKRYLRDDFL